MYLFDWNLFVYFLDLCENPLMYFYVETMGKNTLKRHRVSGLTWEHLDIPQEEMECVAGERGIWNSLLSLLAPRPDLG